MKTISCAKCGDITIALHSNKRFCSQKCADAARYIPKGRLKGKFLTCAFCGINVWTPPWRFKFRNRFCSLEHNTAYIQATSFTFNCAVCNKVVRTQPAQLKYRNRQTCGRTCRAVMTRRKAERRRIELGYTKHQLDRLARYSKESKHWRMAVFKRDNYTCQLCGIRGTYLEADHIKPFAFFPNLRYELSNGRTLCRLCHNKTKMSYQKMRQLYAKENAIAT